MKNEAKKQIQLDFFRRIGRDIKYKVFHTRCQQCGSRSVARAAAFNVVEHDVSGKYFKIKLKGRHKRIKMRNCLIHAVTVVRLLLY